MRPVRQRDIRMIGIGIEGIAASLSPQPSKHIWDAEVKARDKQQNDRDVNLNCGRI